MTRKDYVALADAFSSARQIVIDHARYLGNLDSETRYRDAQLDGIDQAIDSVADILAADNFRFNRARFNDACK